MKLQSKLSIVVIISIVASLIIAFAILLAFGETVNKGYDYADLNNIHDKITRSIQESPTDQNNAMRQQLKQFATAYEGIVFEWVRTDGTLLYSSTGRQKDYSFEEMIDRFLNGPHEMISGKTFSVPYKMNVDHETTYLVLTLQEKAASVAQVFIFIANLPTLLIYITPILLIVIIPVLSSILYSAYLNRRIRRLRRAMQQMDLDHAIPPIADRSRDEIGQLVRLFNQMTHKLNEQVAHIRQVERQRKQLVANLSHDLRTPLALVLGYAENLVRRDAQCDPLMKQWHAIIWDRSLYMKELLSRLFEVSLFDRRQLAVLRKACNLTDLISQIALDYALILEEKNIEPDIRIPRQDIWITADPFLIERAVRNLIDNAIKYGEDGGYLGMDLIDEKDTVDLSVRDRGRGIPSEEQSSIFEPFYRLEKERSRDHNGIGLSIVAEIAKAHHGKVSVVSEPFRETVFTMTLSKT